MYIILQFYNEFILLPVLELKMTEVHTGELNNDKLFAETNTKSRRK